MSRSGSENDVRLTIRAADRSTEIFLVDGRFRRIASGLGVLECSVPPGIYKVRVRSGSTQRDQLIEVPAGRHAMTVITEPVEFNTAAPIAATRTGREVHGKAARDESRRVHLSRGRGSQLFVFVRDLEKQAGSFPWDGVSIRDQDGGLVAGLEAGVCRKRERFGAINVALDPGTYRLRVETDPLGTYEMFVVTVRGWQTQVFSLVEEFHAGEARIRRARLAGSSVLMARSGKGFAPESPHGRLADLARAGLDSGRNVVSGDDLKALLDKKLEDPMLGIYAAHLFLLEYRPDQALLDDVMANLGRLLGAHPDVRALELGPGRRTPPADLTFATPPMLRRSWDLIVRASQRRASLVQGGTLMDRVASGLLATGPWLLHRVGGADPGTESVTLADARRMIEALVQAGASEQGATLAGTIHAQRDTLSALEQRIGLTALRAGAALTLSDPRSAASRDTIAEVLGAAAAPMASVARSVKGLSEKLGLRPAEAQDEGRKREP